MAEIVIQVQKGNKVRVEEVDTIADADPRIPKDRDILISIPSELKIAVKRIPETSSLKAAVSTMCG